MSSSAQSTGNGHADLDGVLRQLRTKEQVYPVRLLIIDTDRPLDLYVLVGSLLAFERAVRDLGDTSRGSTEIRFVGEKRDNFYRLGRHGLHVLLNGMRQSIDMEIATARSLRVGSAPDYLFHAYSMARLRDEGKVVPETTEALWFGAHGEIEPLLEQVRTALERRVPNDPLLVDGVLHELIDNVVRHAGPSASAAIIVRAVGEEVELVVGDNGAGIVTTVIEKIAALSSPKVTRRLGASFLGAIKEMRVPDLTADQKEAILSCVFDEEKPWDTDARISRGLSWIRSEVLHRGGVVEVRTEDVGMRLTNTGTEPWMSSVAFGGTIYRVAWRLRPPLPSLEKEDRPGELLSYSPSVDSAEHEVIRIAASTSESEVTEKLEKLPEERGVILVFAGRRLRLTVLDRMLMRLSEHRTARLDKLLMVDVPYEPLSIVEYWDSVRSLLQYGHGVTVVGLDGRARSFYGDKSRLSDVATAARQAFARWTGAYVATLQRRASTGGDLAISSHVRLEDGRHAGSVPNLAALFGSFDSARRMAVHLAPVLRERGIQRIFHNEATLRLLARELRRRGFEVVEGKGTDDAVALMTLSFAETDANRFAIFGDRPEHGLIGVDISPHEYGACDRSSVLLPGIGSMGNVQRVVAPDAVPQDPIPARRMSLPPRTVLKAAVGTSILPIHRRLGDYCVLLPIAVESVLEHPPFLLELGEFWRTWVSLAVEWGRREGLRDLVHYVVHSKQRASERMAEMLVDSLERSGKPVIATLSLAELKPDRVSRNSRITFVDDGAHSGRTLVELAERVDASRCHLLNVFVLLDRMASTTQRRLSQDFQGRMVSIFKLTPTTFAQGDCPVCEEQTALRIGISEAGGVGHRLYLRDKAAALDSGLLPWQAITARPHVLQEVVFGEGTSALGRLLFAIMQHKLFDKRTLESAPVELRQLLRRALDQSARSPSGLEDIAFAATIATRLGLDLVIEELSSIARVLRRARSEKSGTSPIEIVASEALNESARAAAHEITEALRRQQRDDRGAAKALRTAIADYFAVEDRQEDFLMALLAQELIEALRQVAAAATEGRDTEIEALVEGVDLDLLTFLREKARRDYGADPAKHHDREQRIKENIARKFRHIRAIRKELAQPAVPVFENREQLLASTLGHLAGMLEVQACLLFVPDEPLPIEKGRLTVRLDERLPRVAEHLEGDSDAYSLARLREVRVGDSSITGQAARLVEPQMRSGVRDGWVSDPVDTTLHASQQGVLAWPLVSGGLSPVLVGVITFIRTEVRRSDGMPVPYRFDEEDLRFLALVGEDVALSVFRLFHDREQVSVMRSLRDASLQVVRATLHDVRNTLNVALGQLKRVQQMVANGRHSDAGALAHRIEDTIYQVVEDAERVSLLVQGRAEKLPDEPIQVVWRSIVHTVEDFRLDFGDRLTAEISHPADDVLRRSLAPSAVIVRRVIRELLTNADRHGDRGSRIAVTVECDPLSLRIVVENRGTLPPFSAERLAMPFRSIYTAETSRIGLALVRYLTTAVGGGSTISGGDGVVSATAWFPVHPPTVT